MTITESTIDLRKPRWQRGLQWFATILLALLVLFTGVMTLGLMFTDGYAVAIFFAILTACLFPILRYMLKEAPANWSWRIQIDGDTARFTLPANRSQNHVTPAFMGTLHSSEIARIITREESYRTAGMINAIRVFALDLANGERIFLGEDRSQDTAQATRYTRDAAITLNDRWAIPIEELPAAEGKAGYLGVTGNHAPDWNDSGMNEEQLEAFARDKARTNTILSYLVLLVIALMAIKNFA